MPEPSRVDILSECSAADPDVPFALGVEQRYPLQLSAALPELGRLYAEACVDVWDPETVVDVGALETLARGSGAHQAAAAWARASWQEYRGITESDALLVRMCIEADREPEVKYLLTTRAQTSALAAEACWAVASALGGRSRDGGTDRLPAGRTARALLHAGVSPDAAFVGHVLLGDSVAAARWDAVLVASGHEAISAVAQRLLIDRQRMAEFGRAYMSARVPALDDGHRAVVALAVGDLVADMLGGPDQPDITDAANAAPAASLGAPPIEAARRSVAVALADVVAFLGQLGVAVRPKTEAGPRTSP